MSDFIYYDVLGVHYFSYTDKLTQQKKSACVISVAMPAENSSDPRSWGFNVKEYFIGSNNPVYAQAEQLKQKDKIKLLFTERGYVENMLIKDK